MISLFFIPFFLGIAVTLALWTALRLILWSRVRQNILGALSLIAEVLILIGFLFQLVETDYQRVLIWNYVMFVGLWILIPTWLIFVMFFIGHNEKADKWVNKYTLISYALLSGASG